MWLICDYYVIQGTSVRRPDIAKDDECVWLHFDDPYLKLGPFKLGKHNNYLIKDYFFNPLFHIFL